MQTGQFTSAPNAVRIIVSKEGFKGLYAVCGPQTPHPLPHTLICFPYVLHVALMRDLIVICYWEPFYGFVCIHGLQF